MNKMYLDQQIRSLFAQNSNNRAIQINALNEPYEAWVIRIGTDYGVGIAVDELVNVSERFAGAKLWTSPMNIDNKPYQLLMLTCQDSSMRMEFSAVCAQFVDPGLNGMNRKELVESPLLWWGRWSKLLGNSMISKSTYAVLGELLTLRYLLDKGESPEWKGAFGGVIDIESNNSEYEVKSTTLRYDSIVSIAGQFQLDHNPTTTRSLVFCRFESSTNGESINDIVNELINLGMSSAILEDGLNRCGYESGCAARFETYTLLEMRKYIVDEAFPAITSKSFVNGRLPDAIIQLTYRLDLMGLSYESILN